MRAMTIAIPASIVLSLAAAAQDQGRDSSSRTSAPSTAAPGTATVPQAPVGHRQPTPSTLPPAVRKEEESTGRGAVDQLGPVPKICKNC
jgi:hypothetical protein